MAAEDVAVRLKLEREKRFTSGMDNASGSMRKFGREVDTTSRKTKALGRANAGINKGFRVLGQGAAIGIGAIAMEAVRATKGWAAHQAIARTTAATIKSMGNQSKISAGQVGALSDSIEKRTGLDGDLIQNGANILLTFGKIRNEQGRGNKVMNDAIKTQANMAKSPFFNGDTKGAATMLGKALNDPVKGMGAMSKAGVSFSAGQKKQVESLVKAGKTMEAQKVILGEVNKQFPEIPATPWEKLMTTVHGLEDSLGKVLLPIFNKGVVIVNRFLSQFTRGVGAGGRFRQKMTELGAYIKGTLWPAFLAVARAVGKVVSWFIRNQTAATALIGALAGFVVLVKVANMVQTVARVWRILNLAFLTSPIGLVIAGIALLVVGVIVAYKKFKWFRNAVNAVWDVIKKLASAAPGALKGAFNGVLNWVIRKINSVISLINTAIDVYNMIPGHDDIGKISPIGEVGGGNTAPSDTPRRNPNEQARGGYGQAGGGGRARAAMAGATGGGGRANVQVFIGNEELPRFMVRDGKNNARKR